MSLIPVSLQPQSGFQTPRLERAAAANRIAQAQKFSGFIDGESGKARTSSAFYPAKPWPWLIRGFQGYLYRGASRLLGFQLEISPQDLQKLQQIQKSPGGTIFALNHSSMADVFSLQELGYQTRSNFLTMAVLDNFDRKIWKLPYQLIWPIASRLGYFSVNPNNASIAQSNRFTQNILEQGKYPLCVFPEGRVSWNNDTVAPCQNGTMRFALKAANAGGKPVQAIPIGIYYEYKPKAVRQVEKMLNQLEAAARKKAQKSPQNTFPNLPNNASRQDRINRLCNWMIQLRETENHLPHLDSTAERLKAIQQATVESLLKKYQPEVPINKGVATEAGARQIRHLMKIIVKKQLDTPKPKGWGRLNLWSRERKDYARKQKEFYADIRKLKELEIWQSHREALPMGTALNHQMETLSRLSIALLGRRPGLTLSVRNCTARVKVGEPITVQQTPGFQESDLIPQAERLSEKLQFRLQMAVSQAKTGQDGNPV